MRPRPARFRFAPKEVSNHNLQRFTHATTGGSTMSLGQAKQGIAGGAEMPKIVVYTATSPASSKTSTSSTATAGTLTSTTGKSKPRKSYATTPTTQPGGGNF